MAKGASKDSSSTARPVARGSADTMKIVQKPVDKLIHYINNSRTHSDEQVAQIAASIKEFGWTNPILVECKAKEVARMKVKATERAIKRAAGNVDLVNLQTKRLESV